MRFAASGTKADGSHLTGLYLSLSSYYGYQAGTSVIPMISEFGEFTVTGDIGCFNDAHIVAASPAMGTLGDADLSNWSCSVHEAFVSYPTEGVNGFSALAIARNAILLGTQTFGDGSMGIPYIISRGATPAGCGDGTWNPDLSEGCDDGNADNYDGCSATCKCESGKANGDGTCAPKEICGDGIWQSALGEQCDGSAECTSGCLCESGKANGDGTCVPMAVCGDGIWQSANDEECDGSEGCTTECKCDGGLPHGDGTCDVRVRVTFTDRVTEVSLTCPIFLVLPSIGFG